MKVLVATEKPFSAKAVEGMRDIIESAGLTFELLEKYTSPEELRAAASDAAALIVRSDKVDENVIASAPELKIVVRAGAGYDNVDLKTASAAGVVVENTPGQNSNAVAELVFALALMAARRKFDGTTGMELRSKRLGLQAFGAVGRAVAKIAKGFGMAVSAYDPFCPADVMAAAGVEAVDDIRELYAGNDIVSIHIPATPQTKGSIGYDLIMSMPKGGILINTARKEVVDEEGLKAALAERPDLRYVADVAPACAAELSESCPANVFFTPKKMGAQTAEANLNAGLAAARQVVDFLLNGVDKFRVN